MQSLGCIGAINLDGGGSTVMYVDGKVVNKPQVKGGIPLSNALVLSVVEDDSDTDVAKSADDNTNDNS